MIAFDGIARDSFGLKVMCSACGKAIFRDDLPRNYEPTRDAKTIQCLRCQKALKPK